MGPNQFCAAHITSHRQPPTHPPTLPSLQPPSIIHLKDSSISISPDCRFMYSARVRAAPWYPTSTSACRTRRICSSMLSPPNSTAWTCRAEGRAYGLRVCSLLPDTRAKLCATKCSRRATHPTPLHPPRPPTRRAAASAVPPVSVSEGPPGWCAVPTLHASAASAAALPGCCCRYCCRRHLWRPRAAVSRGWLGVCLSAAGRRA